MSDNRVQVWRCLRITFKDDESSRVLSDMTDEPEEEASKIDAEGKTDTSEIMRWLGGFRSAPKRTFVVHGEPMPAVALKDRIQASLGWSSTVSRMRDRYDLS